MLCIRKEEVKRMIKDEKTFLIPLTSGSIKMIARVGGWVFVGGGGAR